MNDKNYIRKAVELADGWILYSSLDKLGPEYSAPHRTEDCWLCDICQGDKDALAAQLVRQVDAIDEYRLTLAPRGTNIKARIGAHFLGYCKGEDRTMNTIKAIVDSKVLETP